MILFKYFLPYSEGYVMVLILYHQYEQNGTIIRLYGYKGVYVKKMKFYGTSQCVTLSLFHKRVFCSAGTD